jgi:3-deoxy-7-phosphoheptulonate synthase
MASGLSFPVGIKNGTGGSHQIAVNAMVSARSPHTFVGIDDDGMQAELVSIGNPNTHLILRGATQPNYRPVSVDAARAELQRLQLCERMIVDCSHGNAGGEFRFQPTVLSDVLRYRQRDTRYSVSGVMIESNLKPGNHKPASRAELQYGVSVTDGCVGWEQTKRMLEEAYRNV